MIHNYSIDLQQYMLKSKLVKTRVERFDKIGKSYEWGLQNIKSAVY